MTELTTNPNVEKAVAATKDATTPATFDFAAAVQDRSYPLIQVPVYLDERKIQRLLEITKEREDLEIRIAGSKKPSLEQADALVAIDDEYTKVVESLRDQRYTVTIQGIAPETAVEIEAKALEAFPRQYEESTHALTGAAIKTEIPEQKRDELHATLLRQAHIVQVEAPNGAIDADFSDVEKVKATWARLPFVARAKVDQAINESTISVDFYRELVDEVF